MRLELPKFSTKLRHDLKKTGRSEEDGISGWKVFALIFLVLPSALYSTYLGLFYANKILRQYLRVGLVGTWAVFLPSAILGVLTLALMRDSAFTTMWVAVNVFTYSLTIVALLAYGGRGRIDWHEDAAWW